MPSVRIRLAVLLLVPLLLAAPLAQAQSDQQLLVDKAANAALSMKKDPALEALHSLMQRARGVVIVPALIKAGFILGGAGGAGIIAARDHETNSWSDPAFIDLGAASIGAQIGAEVAEIVIVVTSEKALNALLANRVTLSAEAGLVIGTLGGEREAGTATNLAADLYAYSRSKGLFGGLSIEGAMILSDEDWNSAYYGTPATTREIIMLRKLSNPGAQALKSALAELSGAPL